MEQRGKKMTGSGKEIGKKMKLSGKKMKISGKKIFGYGASTKGNTIAQWYNLTPELIKGAAEIHPDKMGRYMVGSQIPIVHEDEARKDADYFIIIGFGFRDIFIEKEKEFMDKGGKFIFCTPKFEIVGK